MDSPLEIAFHNLTPSLALEEDIRKRVAKLERLYPRLAGCRVAVEAPHKQHRTGNIYETHIEMHVPGGKLVVSREPHKPRLRYAKPDAYASVRQAFKAAENQLKAFKEQQRGDIKAHPVMFQARVAEVHRERDHGFITTNEGRHLYFHRNSVMDRDFAELAEGDVVHFIEGEGDTGPTASKVWVGPEFHLD
jgi:cold shock CspA family protein